MVSIKVQNWPEKRGLYIDFEIKLPYISEAQEIMLLSR